MKRPFRILLLSSLAAFALGSVVLAPAADAGNRGGGARAQPNNHRADARTNNVRNSSVNNVNRNTNVRNTNVNNTNVNVNRNTNVNINVDDHHGGCCGWDNDYHPIATAAAVTATVAVTSAIIGSMVPHVPPGCVPVNYGGMVYQQCGSTWYQPQGAQFVVIAPPY
jgi:hypothetical protein